jgi:hypothetical protein
MYVKNPHVLVGWWCSEGDAMTKPFFVLLVAAALIVPLGFAQTPPDTAADARKMSSVPDPVIAPFCVGTAFNAILLTPLDASRNKAGDPVTAEAAETVTYERSVIFPKGTKIHGHLVRASSARTGKGSALFVRFDKAILKNGQEVMMNAGIQALVAGRGSVSNRVIPATGQAYPSAEDFGPRDGSNATVVPASTAVVRASCHAGRHDQAGYVDAGQPRCVGWVRSKGVHPVVGGFGRDSVIVGRKERPPGSGHETLAGDSTSA